MKRPPKTILVLMIICILIFLLAFASVASAESEEDGDTFTITISLAGDCTLGGDLRYGESGSFASVFNRLGEDKYAYFFRNVKPIFEGSDLTIINLEGTLTEKKEADEKQFIFKGSMEYAKILAEGGVDLVNLANNHTLDYGWDGYRDTLRSLDGAGIAYYGLAKAYITEIKGVSIAVLGYKGWGVGVKPQVAKGIEAARSAGADIVIVTFHWGDERAYIPNNIQTTLGRAAIDSGADLVVGHHPHVMQGIELYNGKCIVYSLGNFCYGGHKNPSDKDTFIFQQEFEFYVDSLEMASGNPKIHIIPCSISSVPNYNNYQPTPMTGDEADRIFNRLVDLSFAVNGGDIIDKAEWYVRRSESASIFTITQK